ncbi:MAG TPA: PLD nuclease N-terminal domain-containing protein [Actinocrinis sp.]|nr:PLD nuclease N-terminal domain-containing protein [Actinocrinis sp.]
MPFSASVSAHSGASAAIPWAALVPLIVIDLCFEVYCLVDMIRHRGVRRLPRWAWAVLTLALHPLGGIAYLLFGRSEDQ